ncbi:MAG: hypothetical protein KatS3mg105_2709 [Gemmatales bacterium]|nr:MAG: hypothetical protein KatS3mg105_2709 [Gemmatales bacterium]
MGFAPVEIGSRFASELGVEWEETVCLLCGCARWTHVVEAPDRAEGGSGLWFAVVRCVDCGLCFTNPRPSRQTISRFYPSHYQPHRLKSKRGGVRLGSSRSPRKWLKWHGQGRLLDFGCGGGSFVERMARQGWQVTGIDMSENAVRRVRDELGLPALVGTLPHPELSPESFDVVTMWQSLEHVHDPLGVLRQARRLLVPGGKLIVAVPNILSLPFRWFGPAWYGLDLPRHLTHFDPQTLSGMLQRAEFDIQSIKMIRHSGWLRSSARLAAASRQGPRWRWWLRNKPFSRLASWYSYLCQMGDCILAEAVK